MPPAGQRGPGQVRVSGRCLGPQWVQAVGTAFVTTAEKGRAAHPSAESTAPSSVPKAPPPTSPTPNTPYL